ncbi:hypothetical protein E4U57_002884 [Claviceps arundinis]|uniref:Transposase n=1 Tax=Claviceps arundinis TaxID=1623583 RepID=A0ABQ7PK56_9HYPO|nr:hypothetical protein E4U57_002884 [Claviceps arundinis]
MLNERRQIAQLLTLCESAESSLHDRDCKKRRGNASTPPVSLHIIQDYDNVVETRVESSVLSKVPLWFTPSVIRTFSKARKAGHSLASNGITATREMRLIKEEALARTNRHAQTAVIAAVPLRKGKKNRISKRKTYQEMAFLRRWVAKVMLKKNGHAYLDHTSCISQHYDLLREMCAAKKGRHRRRCSPQLCIPLRLRSPRRRCSYPPPSNLSSATSKKSRLTPITYCSFRPMNRAYV